MEREYLELSELLSGVKEMVAEAFPGRYWVKAEIRQCAPNANGHCYLTLSESRGGRSIAEARSIIWKWKYPQLAAFFREATGESLRAGITVLVKVQINFSELYGVSLYVEDIDPAFTLGEQALERKRAIEKLTKEGYMDMQKELCIPSLPYNLAIISSPTAAGLQDFLRHLEGNAYGFAFNPVLFEASMQGDGASASVIAALDRIARVEKAAGKNFDAVLILRGGGSETDLACFDDYDMAVAIATCPSPVVTAIGHDKDYHIADMVANAFVKTPTALADLFIDAVAAEDERITALEESVAAGSRRAVEAGLDALAGRAVRLERAVRSRFTEADRSIQLLTGRIARGLLAKSHLQDAALEGVRGRIARGLLAKNHQLQRDLDERVARLRFAAGAKHSLEYSRVALAESRIAGADPREILSRGYVLVTGADNRVLKSAGRVHVGERIGVRFSDGHLRATVNEVATEEDRNKKVSIA